jgi:hypothetical protein
LSDDEINGRDLEEIVKDETFKSLKDQLDDPALKSSTRILILVLLA